MIKDGVLDGVDHVLGAHVMSTMEAGKVSIEKALYKLDVLTLN